MKFALVIVASLIAAVYGQPAFQQFQTTGLRTLGTYGLGNLGGGYYRSAGISGLAGLGGLGYGYGLGYGTGLGNGLGYGLGYGRTVALAPATSIGYVAAAPALSYAAAAPAVQTVALQAAPAVQTVALQAAAPAAQTVAYAAAPAATAQYTGPIHAAIESRRTVEVIDAPVTQEAPVANHVVIGPNVQPINLEFQTQASPLAATQNHVPTAPAETQHSSYEEQPDLLRQDIVKPVVQDVHETIVPFRRITQELKPVQETVHQILPRGQERGFYQQQQVAHTAHTAVQAVQAAPAAPAAVAVQAAPAAVAVQAAPAVSALRVAAAPAAVAVQAAPATFAVHAAPAAHATYGVIGVRPAAAGYIGLGAGYGTGYGAGYGTGYGTGYGLTTGLTSGLIGGGYYGSSYALRPAGNFGYSTFSTGAYPIRKK